MRIVLSSRIQTKPQQLFNSFSQQQTQEQQPLLALFSSTRIHCVVLSCRCPLSLIYFQPIT